MVEVSGTSDPNLLLVFFLKFLVSFVLFRNFTKFNLLVLFMDRVVYFTLDQTWLGEKHDWY